MAITIVEPPFITFLRNFATSVQAKAKEIDLNGVVNYEFKDINERQTVLVIWFR